jgi:tRNA threonylcarbamoyladenosine biosynthesis protein TsaE
MSFLSHSPDQTKKIAAEFAATIRGGEVIALEGELGAGKTTFVQGFVEALGGSTPVHSPTFTLMNLYEIPSGPIKTVVHVDFYRIEKPEELEEIGLEEFFGRKDVVVLIEWPKGYIRYPHATVSLRGQGETKEIDIRNILSS